MKEIGGSGNGCSFEGGHGRYESAAHSIDKESSIRVGGIIIYGNCCFFLFEMGKDGDKFTKSLNIFKYSKLNAVAYKSSKRKSPAKSQAPA